MSDNTQQPTLDTGQPLSKPLPGMAGNWSTFSALPPMILKPYAGGEPTVYQPPFEVAQMKPLPTVNIAPGQQTIAEQK